MKLFRFKKRDEAKPPIGEIVIIDDTPDNLHLLNEILSERGYKVRALPNGEMGLSACLSSPPNLILLDINMPGMDGFEVAEKLKADARTKDVPIIFISALTQTEDKIRAFGAGGVDYVSKPLQAQEVVARVETHISISRMREQINEANQKLLTWNMEMAQRGPGGSGGLAPTLSKQLARLFGKAAEELREGDESQQNLSVLAVTSNGDATPAAVGAALEDQLGGAVLASFSGLLVAISVEQEDHVAQWLEENFKDENLGAALASGEGVLRIVGGGNESCPRVDFKSEAVMRCLAGLTNS